MSGSGIRTLNCQRWLDAYTEPHAAIYTFSHCMTLADLHADGDHKLVVADLGTGAANLKLKVYKGTSLMSESTLLDVPTAVVSFHMDTNDPRIPAVAVVSGSNIYVYKNMRPYFKFSLPSLDVNALELDLWAHATNRGGDFNNKVMEVSVLHDTLQNLRDEVGFSNLAAQSQHFLTCDASKRQEFVLEHKDSAIRRQAVITCATTLKRNMSDANAVSCLVVGTENGEVFFLDPQAFTILDTVTVGGGNGTTAPVHMCATGLLEVEYRVWVSCRDGTIGVLRRGCKRARVVAQLGAQCVAMVVAGTHVVVATMDNSLQCFSKNGKKQWVASLPSPATALATVALPHQGVALVAAALKGGAVHFYSGRDLVDVITVSDTVSAILFGQFGQEEHSLVLVTVGGCLSVKILKRTAVFTDHPSGGGNPAPSAAAARLAVPPKTRLYLEQAQRERDGCAALHRAFQRDLFRLRLNVARARVEALRTSADPVSTHHSAPLKMSAQVLGLGPTFKVLVTLENMSSTLTPSSDLALTFHCDERTYAIDQPFVQVPVLVPGLTYRFETMVACVSETGVSDEVRIFVTQHEQTRPLLAALINMPLCDIPATT